MLKGCVGVWSFDYYKKFGCQSSLTAVWEGWSIVIKVYLCRRLRLRWLKHLLLETEFILTRKNDKEKS